jgi:hypothetical protein
MGNEVKGDEGKFELKDSSNYASVAPTEESITGVEAVEETQAVVEDNVEELTLDGHEEAPAEDEAKVVEKKKSLSRTDEARLKMKEAEELIVAADNEVKEVEGVVKEHLSAFNKEKSSIANGAISNISALFEKVNYDYSKEELPMPFEVSLGTTKEKLQASTIGTGRFSGLFLGLLGMLGTAGAWIYFASQKTGTVLDPSTIDVSKLETLPSDEKFQPMLNWIGGGMTGGAGNALFGIITLIVTSLLIGYFIYKMRVSMKESKNVKVANRVFDKSHEYVANQKESKSEMEKIDAHIQEITPLIKDYRVLLNEQDAKLHRVLHVEGALAESSSYDLNSQHIMKDSDELMTRIEKLIDTPVSTEGRLNEESVKALMEAKAAYGTYLTKLYS